MKLGLELTNRCNLHCVECHRDFVMDRDESDFDLYELDNFLCNFEAIGGKRLEIGLAGEPLLHKKAKKAIQLLDYYGFQTRIYSNATCIDVLNNVNVNDNIHFIFVPHLYQRKGNDIVMKSPFEFVDKVNSVSDKISCEVNIITYGDNKFWFKILRDCVDVKVTDKPYEDWFALYDIEQLELAERLNCLFSKQNSGCYGKLMPCVNVNGDFFVCCMDFNAETLIGNIYESELIDLFDKWKNVNLTNYRICRACWKNPDR